jgi:PAS domain S-box-containing protein
VDRFVQGYEGSGLYVNNFGVEILGSAKGIPVAGWYAGVALPTKEAFAPVRNMQIRILLSTIVLTLLMGVLTWWMLGRQLAPMLAAAKTLANLSQANQPPQPLPITRDDEIGELISGFNRLLATLGKRDAALQASEQRLDLALDSGQMGVWDLDLIHDTAWRSLHHDRIFGYESMLSDWGRTIFLQHVVPDDREQVIHSFEEAFRTGQLSIECQIARADQRQAWIMAKGQVYRDENAHPVRIMGTVIDITERKQAEEDLKESREKFRGLSEASFEAIFFSDKGICIEQNRTAELMFGYSDSEALGRSGTQWIAPRDRDLVIHNMLTGNEEPYEATALRKDGTTFPALLRGRMMQYKGKRIRVTSLSDITERKQADAARAALETQLRESQKMEALGTLAGGVAHDFNNALAAILGNVELARQDVGPGHEALVSLEEIGKASRRAKDLVQQILAFGRRQTLERRPTSLALVVVETARLVRATLPAMVSLAVDCKVDTPAVLADAAQVKQILLNLCGNALQAVQDQARTGVIEIRLDAYNHAQGEARSDLRPGRYACLTVRDNGPGMDEATRSRIFEPFFTTKSKGKGTGLGLSVVHGIVKAHEASIEVESTPGEGSTFRIYFPATEESVPEVTTPTPDTAPVHGKGKHILYVDDEEAIIFLMKRLLERQGYRVSGYIEPREALEAVRANPDRFDLAVTDYNMPGMSGLDVAIALRDIRADLPVVLASGYITEELRQKAPAAGVRELIYKPNTADDLCEAVARLAQTVGETSKSS